MRLCAALAVVTVVALAAPAAAQTSPASARWQPRWRPWSSHGRVLDEEVDEEVARVGIARGAITTRWRYAATPPSGSVSPATYRHPHPGVVAAGSIVLTLGYAAAIALGAHALTDFAGPDCGSTYGALHFVPVVGALIAFAHAGYSCDNRVIPVMLGDLGSSAVQLAGTTMLLVGLLAGQEAVRFDGPLSSTIHVAPIADATTIGARLTLEH